MLITFLRNILLDTDIGRTLYAQFIERINLCRILFICTYTPSISFDGQASVSRLVDKAMKDGMKGIAVTDHGNMFGIKESTNYVNKKNSGPKGEIKDLEKRIAGIESGEIECEDKEAEIWLAERK